MDGEGTFRMTDDDHRAIAGYMVEAGERKQQQDQRDTELNELLQERRERLEAEANKEKENDEGDKDKTNGDNGSSGGRQRNRPQPPSHFLDRPLSIFPGGK